MQINYTTDAFYALIQLVNYIESKNTQGAGLRWLSRFEKFLERKLKSASQIKLCNNIAFQQLNLRCIYFNEWIVAFSVYEDSVLIEALLHKSRISD
ncbi:hypothetical protein [Parafilimonas terrae]|jgi:hypothetical protein|uniref:ParE toxin of type II toxin-antitoxin system, parDE n=1 Tax=Parafilimonas terrae TaxID=1465490 RepID=A0A1I5YUD9_9BACT|nr:hypothetical protein [Parafilimonas terrae]SFQ47883.1 hypothetical protein SAMN05444277_11447 [Parafilimonas terrae]